MRFLTRLLSVLIPLFALAVFISTPASAQQPGTETLPDLPAPIQTLVDQGAQIRYLGNAHGFDSWLTIKGGQEQYFYVPPGGEAFVMGLLFDKNGQLLTVDQVQNLRQQGDTLLDSLAGEFSSPADQSLQASVIEEEFEFKTPGEQLYHDIRESNWVALGEAGAPVLYSFIDPQCPHCHAFINDLRQQFLPAGRIQLRMIPVGRTEESVAQAAFLLAAPDAQARWFAHMDGQDDAIPARSEINQQGVQRNISIMQSWKFDVTPMSIYRAKDGTVKIIKGRPADVASVINDLGDRT